MSVKSKGTNEIQQKDRDRAKSVDFSLIPGQQLSPQCKIFLVLKYKNNISIEDEPVKSLPSIPFSTQPQLSKGGSASTSSPMISPSQEFGCSTPAVPFPSK